MKLNSLSFSHLCAHTHTRCYGLLCFRLVWYGLVLVVLHIYDVRMHAFIHIYVQANTFNRNISDLNSDSTCKIVSHAAAACSFHHYYTCCFCVRFHFRIYSSLEIFTFLFSFFPSRFLWILCSVLLFSFFVLKSQCLINAHVYCSSYLLIGFFFLFEVWKKEKFIHAFHFVAAVTQ